MIDTGRSILIACLLHGALGQWAVWMPQSIEALSGSCVLIPCTFDIPSQYEKYLVTGAQACWKKRGPYAGPVVFDSSITETTPVQNQLSGAFIGQLPMKNCTTILDRFPSSYTDTYFFRWHQPIRYSFFPGVKINVQDSAPKPNITTETVEVMEGTSVSLSCSAAAPCPKLPPNLTWTPRLSDSVYQLQENEDQTKFVSSVMTFTASHLHHGQNITCGAIYPLQQGDIQKTSEASLTLRVLYPPKDTSVSVSPSASVLEGSSVTLTCSSNANPAVQNYTWYKVSGTEMNTVGTGKNLTLNVTSGSEQYYCEAQNEHGKENSTVKLEVDLQDEGGDAGEGGEAGDGRDGGDETPIQVQGLVCESSFMQAGLDRAHLEAKGLDPSSAYLADFRCTAHQENTGMLWFRVERRGGNCGTRLTTNSTHAIYSNSLYVYPVAKGNGKFSNPERFQFSCIYPLDAEASLDVAIGPHLLVEGAVVGVGPGPRAAMSLYRNANYTDPYSAGAVVLPLGSALHVGVSAEEAASDRFAVIIENCYATPSAEPDGHMRFFLIQNRCPSNNHLVNVEDSRPSLPGRFTALVSLFSTDYATIYLHCSLSMCDPTQAGCSQTCRFRVSRSISFENLTTIGPISWETTSPRG